MFHVFIVYLYPYAAHCASSINEYWKLKKLLVEWFHGHFCRCICRQSAYVGGAEHSSFRFVALLPLSVHASHPHWTSTTIPLCCLGHIIYSDIRNMIYVKRMLKCPRQRSVFLAGFRTFWKQLRVTISEHLLYATQHFFSPQFLFQASWGIRDSPPPKKKQTYNFLQRLPNCALNFLVRDNEVQIYHGNFLLVDKKHRKLFVIKQSKWW